MQSLPSYTDLSKIPIAFNPNGDPPNFTDPPSLAHIVSAVGITLIVISSLVVVVRLATNFQHTGKLELDDCKWVLDLISFANWLEITWSLADFFFSIRPLPVRGNRRDWLLGFNL